MADVRGYAFPDDLRYDADLNVWFRDLEGGQDGGLLEAGLTAFGLALVGELYMFNPRPVGRDIEAGRAFALIEVAKTVLSVRTPFACQIAEINEPLTESPTRINRQPFESWLVRLKVPNLSDAHALLLQGSAVVTRAVELMELNQMDVLADGQHGQRAS